MGADDTRPSLRCATATSSLRAPEPRGARLTLRSEMKSVGTDGRRPPAGAVVDGRSRDGRPSRRRGASRLRRGARVGSRPRWRVVPLLPGDSGRGGVLNGRRRRLLSTVGLMPCNWPTGNLAIGRQPTLQLAGSSRPVCPRYVRSRFLEALEGVPACRTGHRSHQQPRQTRQRTCTGSGGLTSGGAPRAVVRSLLRRAFSGGQVRDAARTDSGQV